MSLSSSLLRAASTWSLAFLLFIGWSSSALAQQTAPATIRLQAEDVGRGYNGMQRNFFFLPPGATGENYEDAGFFGQRLRPYLGSNQEALDNLNDYRRQKRLFLMERLVFVGAVGLYGQQILGEGEQEYFNPTQRVALGVAVGSLIANAFINRNTNKHLQQAIEAYNADVDLDRRGSLWRRARPQNLGLQCTPQGQPLLALSWSLR